MNLESTPIEDLFVLHRPLRRDARGFFTRLFGTDEIAAAGRPTQAIHVNSSTSTAGATLRGIHFQYAPHCETKLVSCVAGAIWDVGVDLRPGSLTRFQWFGTVLTPDNGKSLLIPEGFGHAFITLEPNSTVVYVVSAAYSVSHESGICFDDPMLGITWPIKPKVLSEKDRNWGVLEHRVEELDAGFATINRF